MARIWFTTGRIRHTRKNTEDLSSKIYSALGGRPIEILLIADIFDFHRPHSPKSHHQQLQHQWPCYMHLHSSPLQGITICRRKIFRESSSWEPEMYKAIQRRPFLLSILSVGGLLLIARRNPAHQQLQIRRPSCMQLLYSFPLLSSPYHNLQTKDISLGARSVHSDPNARWVEIFVDLLREYKKLTPGNRPMWSTKRTLDAVQRQGDLAYPTKKPTDGLPFSSILSVDGLLLIARISFFIRGLMPERQRQF